MSEDATPREIVETAVIAARSVQPEWEARGWAYRSAILKRVGRLVAERADALAELVSAENGKTKTDALATEILPAVLAVDFYRSHCERLMRPRSLEGGSILLFNKRSRAYRRPYGIVGIISPWNYPFSIPFSEVVMALLAGNAVLLKTATDTQGVGKALAALFADAGLPPGLLTHIEMAGSLAGPAFIQSGIDKLFFTGSTSTGKTLMALAADRLLPLVLELGGNDAAIVRADADLDRAATGIAWAAFSNAGQSCGGAQRVLVHQAVYERFVDKLAARVEALRVGPPESWTSDVGRMTTGRQKAAVEAQVDECLRMGAKVRARSRPAPSAPATDDRFMDAVLLVDAPDDSPIMRDEVFGPVAAVRPVADDAEAVRIANESPYALTASIWTRDARAAETMATRINAGSITINDHLMSHGLAETPWGGFGASGIGRTHGELGFEEMLRPQVVVRDILPGAARAIWWHPYSEGLYAGLRALVSLIAGSGLGSRLRALPRVIGVFFRYWRR